MCCCLPHEERAVIRPDRRESNPILVRSTYSTSQCRVWGNRTTAAPPPSTARPKPLDHTITPRGAEIKDKIRCRKVATLHHKGTIIPQPTKTPCATLPSSAQLIDKLEMEIMGLTPQPKNNDKIYYTAKIPPFPQIPKSNTHHLPRQCVPKSSYT